MYAGQALEMLGEYDLTRFVIDCLRIYNRSRHARRLSRVVSLVGGISLLPGQGISEGGTLEHQGPSHHDDVLVHDIQVE